MLSRATEVGDVDKARMVYDRLRRLGMGKMTGLMHAEMMALLTRSGRLDEAIALQGTLLKDPTRKRGFAPSLFIYIIGALMQKCDYEAASKQVDLMLSAKSGFRTCRQKAAAENACNIALDLYIRMNDQKRALWILELMQTRSLTPRAELLHKFADSMAKTDNGNFAAVENVSTISGLARSQLNRRFNLMSQINNGNLTAAERDLGEMIRQGWNPDAPILKAMLEAYAKKGDVVGSQRAFERLEELGTPNVFAYTMLIQAHLNVGDLAQARWRFDNMKVAGLQPDTVLYTLMMKAYVELQSTGGIKEAEALLREMRAVGVPRNQRTYFTLIAASRDSPERAGAYISEMRREGIDPDAGCFGAMIDVCVRAGNMRKAYGYFQSMAGLNIRPNAVIFNILLAEHHKNGEFDAIRRLYKEMVMGRIAPDANTIHKIVDAYCKFGKDMDIVEEVIEKLLAATSPSFRPRQQIFHSVMNGYAHAGMPASCERWRDRMLASGFEATFITSNILLNAYCRAEDHFKVMALFKQMLKNGQVTPATMAQVLDSCGLNGAPEDATWVVERARAAGTSLDENGYNSYLEALGRHRRIGEIRPALYSMLADGVEPTSKTFLTAVNAVERQGKLREAKEVRSFFETHFPSLVK
ncbi:hypothetical protein HK104_002956 [Borealophlyctis nickersoniae]|nr:hypothetical protein HK104_002956 [Borealophlyctis nickersoniae]